MPPFPPFHFPISPPSSGPTGAPLPGPIGHPGSTAEWYGSGGGQCYLACNSPVYCDEPVVCSIPIITTGMNYSVVSSLGKAEHGRGVYPVEVFPPGGSWTPEPQEPDVITVTLTNRESGGEGCSDTIPVICAGCNCANAAAFSINTSASDTIIDPNGSATIVIQGGCPPYEWSVSGTGYTLANSRTQGLTNTLFSTGGT